MKKLNLLALLLLLSLTLSTLNGCAGSQVKADPMAPASATATPIVKAQEAAQSTLYAIGSALAVAPGICDALYDAGKLSKDAYNNQVLPVYNQALGSYNLAVKALRAAVDAGVDPNSSAAYLAAFNQFMTDKALIDNLLAAFGQQPIGTGVTQ